MVTDFAVSIMEYRSLESLDSTGNNHLVVRLYAFCSAKVALKEAKLDVWIPLAVPNPFAEKVYYSGELVADIGLVGSFHILENFVAELG